MRDPVRGEFRVTGSYFAHPGSNSYRLMLTGVVTGPGLPPTAGEHLDDKSGRWFDDYVLPVTVDRSDPAQFVILWDEVAKPDHRADARQQAARAAEQMGFSGSAGAPLQATGSVSGGAPAPDWAREMLASLPADVLSGASQAPQPIIIDAGTQVIDLTAGHLSSADAERLSALGEPATAVVTAVTDVPVPQAALPGPTASLCDLSLQVTHQP